MSLCPIQPTQEPYRVIHVPDLRAAAACILDQYTYVVPVKVFILGSDRGRRLRGRWHYSNLYLSVPRPYPRTRSLSLPVPEE